MEDIVEKTRNSFQGILNERCSFDKLLTRRAHYLEKIIYDIGSMATRMEELSPGAKQNYDAMNSRGRAVNTLICMTASFVELISYI
jgi:hypothetical protein